MKQLQEYIAFDLEFNTVGEHSHIIQVSAVKYSNHQEIALFDTYVHTKVPLQSFINGLTGITARDIIGAPKIETILTDLQSFVGDTPLIGYNGHKSDLPLLVENGLDLTSQYQVDLYDEAFVRRSTVFLIAMNGMVWYFKQQVVYLCPNCHQTFTPTYQAFNLAKHTPKTRKVFCPHCHQKSHCIELAREER